MSGSSSNAVSSKRDETIRVAVMGAAGVGKTALVVKLLSGRFIWNYDPTLESVHRYNLTDARMPDSSANNEEQQSSYSLEVMDTAAPAHQLELKTSSYVKWADGVVLVYCVTNSKSFEEVQRLRDVVFEIKKLGLTAAIVGNKADLEHFRKVETAKVKKYANDNECRFYELSAKMDLERVRQLFREVCKDVISNRIKAGIKLNRRSSASQLLRKLIQKKLSI